VGAKERVDASRIDDIENALLRLVRELLGLGAVSASEDLLSLGATSLTVLRLDALIHGAFGANVGIATIYDAKSLGQLAVEIGRLVARSALAEQT
jgi:hypothetical protein